MHKIGDIVQVRDKRDGALAIAKAEVVEIGNFITVQEIGGMALKVAVPASCVEPFGHGTLAKRVSTDALFSGKRWL